MAPSRESTKAPKTPDASTTGIELAGNPAGASTLGTARAVMTDAPSNAPAVPHAVTPPEEPAGTRRHDMIRRGSPPSHVPISVDQLSAAAAESAPAPATAAHAAGRPSPRVTMLASAAKANTPPLASTCQASRAPPFSTIAPVRASLAAAPRRVRALDDTK